MDLSAPSVACGGGATTGKAGEVVSLRRVFFPFTAIVGLEKAKLALLAVSVDPTIGGVLLAGDKGTGKSTLVRALAQVLPEVPVVKGCPFNCNPLNPAEMCDEHYRAWLRGMKLEIEYRPMRVIDLPLSVTPDRLVGSVDVERTIKEGRIVFKPGLLAEANRNILYIDEVNLLEDYIADLLLDAAASGWNIVEREGISFKHPARFILVGTMNPEEGELRPQILDRFGLFVDVSASMSPKERMEIVLRVEEFHRDPLLFYRKYEAQENALKKRVTQAMKILPKTTIDKDLLKLIIDAVIKSKIRTHRAEITIVKTAKAIAALSGRSKVSPDDVRKAMELALPHRLKTKPFEEPSKELKQILNEVFGADYGDYGEGEHVTNSTDSSPPKALEGNDPLPGEGATGVNPGIDSSLDTLSRHRSMPVIIKLRFIKERNLTAGWGGGASRRSFTTQLAVGRGITVDAIPWNDIRDVDLIASIRSAVARRAEAPVRISDEDLRVRVRRVPRPLLHIVLLDASGSMLANKRIRVAKGIVEDIAKRSYVDRAYVSVLTFKGRDAQVIIGPTRLYGYVLKSLKSVRIGGSTPLAAGLVKALSIAKAFALKNRGTHIVLHLVTDGRVNVPLNHDLMGELKELGTLFRKHNIKVRTYLVREKHSLPIGTEVIRVFTNSAKGELIDIL